METKTLQGIHKSKGGLIRSLVRIKNGIIDDINISGDFFMFPEESLFKIIDELKGIGAERKEIEKKIEEIYIRENIQTPGSSPVDFAESIMKALEA